MPRRSKLFSLLVWRLGHDLHHLSGVCPKTNGSGMVIDFGKVSDDPSA